MDGFAFGHLDLPEKEVQHFSFLLPVTNYFRTKHQCLKEGLKGVREEWKETGVWAHRVVRQIDPLSSTRCTSCDDISLKMQCFIHYHLDP